MTYSIHLLFSCFFTILVFVAGTNFTRNKREANTLHPYNYRIDGRYGQRNWGNYYPKCYLKRQSPIDINLNNIKFGNFETSLRTTNIDTKPLEVEMRNNGYTAYVSYYWACCAPKIYGGPLKDVYEFMSLHFHWGPNNTCGSEHSVDGKHTTMECHMIFRNVKYGTKEEALDHPDGLCVFALRYEVCM